MQNHPPACLPGYPHVRRLVAQVHRVLLRCFTALMLAGPAITAHAAADGTVLPLPVPPFAGQLGDTIAQSQAARRAVTLPKPDAPNVLIVLLDDVGFGQPSAFGGPIPMPALDALAQRGLRYNQFHTTAMCSPTRAAMLTGRNAHRTGNGNVPEGATAFPGYDGSWGRNAASLAEVLRHHGYSTAMFGKWHNTIQSEAGPAGPFTTWPVGKGFDYFYGFLGGDTDQFSPALYENISSVEPPRVPGYTLNNDLANRTIRWIQEQRLTAPNRPFFAYLAPGAAHSPLQAPKEWIDRFKGKFDHGWDAQRELTFERQKAMGVIPPQAKLTARPPELVAWDGFSADERRVMARLQEVYAGFLAQTDHEVGRVLEALQQMGVSENTLVLYVVGDNGPSAEGSLIGTFSEMLNINGLTPSFADLLPRIDELGGPTTSPHYPVGWAWAGSTPFPYFKRMASHLGGIRNGLVVSWPKRIRDTGGLRAQFSHVIDIMPTVLEAVGVPMPRMVDGVEQLDVDGQSLVATFERQETTARPRTQYFEVHGTYAIYHDGWLAGARHNQLMPWQFRLGESRPLSADQWQLFDLRKDFSQADDLAASQPAKLAEMQALFRQEAQRNLVYPIAHGPTNDPSLALVAPGNRTPMRLMPGNSRLREGLVPTLGQTAHVITAQLGAARGNDAGARDGVVLTQGGRFGGFTLWVQDGHPVYSYNHYGRQTIRIRGDTPLPPEAVVLQIQFSPHRAGPGSPADVVMKVNGKPVGQAVIPSTQNFRFSLDETLDVGEDFGTPVDELYSVPNRFRGDLTSVLIEFPARPL